MSLEKTCSFVPNFANKNVLVYSLLSLFLALLGTGIGLSYIPGSLFRLFPRSR